MSISNCTAPDSSDPRYCKHNVDCKDCEYFSLEEEWERAAGEVKEDRHQPGNNNGYECIASIEEGVNNCIGECEICPFRKFVGRTATVTIYDEFGNYETKEKVMNVYDYVILSVVKDDKATLLAEGRILAKDMSQARTTVGQKNPDIDLTGATVQIRPFCE